MRPSTSSKNRKDILVRRRAMGSSRRLLPSLVIPIVTFWLGGCEGRIKGILEPVASTVPGASQVEMLVVTTRARTTPAEMFSGDRGPGLDFADIVVSIPPDSVRQTGEVQWPRQIPGDPATDFVTLEPTSVIDQPQALAVLRRLVRKAPEKHVLVFVHGYNNRFEDAVFRFAQFVHDSGADVAPVLFSWPSKGSSFAYEYDRESASYSRDALEQGLRMLAKTPEVSEISILAHSMGNWVTLEALRQMAIRDGKVAGKIRNVVLAAPDVDPQVARQEIATMGPQRPNFTLIVSKGEVWGGPRLGAIDPDIEPYKSELAHEKIDVVNLTNMHSADVGERIMATTVSAAVGKAASLVVGIWQFLKDNIAVIGTIASGFWAVFLYFATKFAKKREKGSTTPSVTADHSGVAAGRDISGAINTNARDDSNS